MARTLQEILTSLDDAQAAESGLSGLNSTSQSAIYTLWKYITALVMLLHEKLIDIKKVEIETTVSKSIVPSEEWLQSKVFEFQYSSTVPQIMQLINFAPSYNPINTALRIITRCSVKTTGQRIVTVKVAKSEPPVALSAPELSALVSYLTLGGDGTVSGAGVGIAYAGVQINATSSASDKLYFKATISYNGQYSAIIVSNVVSAVDVYLASIPFDGAIKVLDLVDYVQNVTGVTDILIEDLAIRADAGAYVYLIQSFTQAHTTYPMFAGYAVTETNPGDTIYDTLTFVAS